MCRERPEITGVLLTRRVPDQGRGAFRFAGNRFVHGKYTHRQQASAR